MITRDVVSERSHAGVFDVHARSPGINIVDALTLRRVNFLVFDEDLALQQFGTRQRNVGGQLHKHDKNSDKTFTSRYNLVIASDRDFARYLRYMLCTLRFELSAKTVFALGFCLLQTPKN